MPHHRPRPDHSEPVPPRHASRHRRRPANPYRRRRKRSLLTVTTSMGALVAVGGLVAGITLYEPSRSLLNVSADGGLNIGATADTYVIKERPSDVLGSKPKLTASFWDGWHTETHVTFEVPQSVKDTKGARLEFAFKRLDHQPALVELHKVPDTTWSEGDTSWSNRPAVGETLASAEVSEQGTRKISFDVSAWVDKPGRYSFALTNPTSWSAASLYSRESGELGPRLVLPKADVPSGAPSTTPAPTATATPPAVALPVPGPEPTWGVPEPTPTPTSKPVSESPATTGDRTLCGASFTTARGETFQQALSRVDTYYGGLEMVRLFYPGLPTAWPGRMDTGTRPMVISFKLDPKDVLAGKHDAYMRQWFATAPRDQDIYWVYYHEPEDNIRSGEFTAADYRAAWKRLRSLADKAGNQRLKATLVLMSWTAHPKSGRNWRDYYPGRDVIQVLGWDVYNLTIDKGRYEDPVEMYDEVIAISKAEKLPFGVAETGSYLVPGDSGAQRADWLRAMVRHLSKSNALWVAYFDLDWPSGDFRLLDASGRKAWRDFC